MLKEKSHCCIKQDINITLRSLVINKLFFGSSLKTCHSQKTLRIVIEIHTKQHSCRIIQIPITKQTKLPENRRYFFPNSHFWKTTISYTLTYCTKNSILIKVRYFQIGIDHCFPTIFSTTLHQQMVILLLRHYCSSTFYTKISPTFVSERTHKTLFFRIDNYNKLIGIWNPDIVYFQKHKRFDTINSLSNSTFCTIRNVLTYYISIVLYSIKYNTTIAIKKGT